MRLLLTTPHRVLQPGQWEVVRETFRHDSTGGEAMFWGVVAIVVILIGLLITMRVVGWVRRRRLRTKPIHVFHRLSDHLKIPLSDQWLLIRIARQQALPTPLTLLLSVGTLRHHGQRYAQTYYGRRRATIITRLGAIESTLFS